MTFTDEQQREIEKMIADTLRPMIHVLTTKVDSNRDIVMEVRGIATNATDVLFKELESSHQIHRQTHQNIFSKIDAAFAQLATLVERWEMQRKDIYGSNLPGESSIMKTIDRLHLETRSLRADVGIVDDLRRELADVRQATEALSVEFRELVQVLREDMRFWIVTGRFLQRTLPSLISKTKEIWSKPLLRWLILLGGTGGAALVEFIKALIEAANK